VLACLVAFIPVFSIAAFSIFKNLNNSTYVLSIVLTIPRLFMIMNGLHSLINLVFEWPRHKTKIQEVIICVESPKEENLKNRIKYDGLNIFSNNALGVTSHLELVEDIKKMSTGRFTIQGVNGTGKSTFLQTLKEEFEEAIYVPPYNSLIIDLEDSSEIAMKDMSTGQKQFKNILNILNQIKSAEEYKIFLLDEWDSNLDQEKIQLLSKQINLLAATSIIVEIRHNY
jgi:ABC-type bacteriocin/lantibiotic exporter with double-glycine peptidase domain